MRPSLPHKRLAAVCRQLRQFGASTFTADEIGRLSRDEADRFVEIEGRRLQALLGVQADELVAATRKTEKVRKRQPR